MDQNQLRYSFNYNKRGFEPIEFKDCLTSKVDKLLEPINLQQINTIKRQEIDKVKEQVCIREDINMKNRNLASRHDEPNENDLNENNTRDDGNTPMNDNVRDSIQEKQRQIKNKLMRKKHYHEEQCKLFKVVLQQEFQEFFPDIIIDERKGYLYRSGKVLKTTEFCNVIDEISAYFLKNLETLCPDNHQRFNTRWRSKLESVSESCKRILEYRLAVESNNDNDLMRLGSYKVWSDHVKVIMSFAALMVVVKMSIAKIDEFVPWKVLVFLLLNSATAFAIYLSVDGSHEVKAMWAWAYYFIVLSYYLFL
ncbi:hypothetical protein ABFA07_001543 [Porites harrisoni]